MSSKPKPQKSKFKIVRYIFILIIIIVAIYISYVYIFLKPSNDRDWEVGFEKLPRITIDGTQLTIKDLRDYEYATDQFVGVNYLERTVDVSQLTRAWFVMEPFEGGIPLINIDDSIAHTYFIFDFANSDPIAVSVEARREKDERFNLFTGLTNQFELMYIWGTERDLTGRRVLIEHNKIYMYPLTISQQSAQNLFMQVVHTTKQLETTPRFYNTMSSNCTNELAKNANLAKPNSIPYNLTWFAPGYAEEELYDLKFIPNDEPLSQISQKYLINFSK